MIEISLWLYGKPSWDLELEGKRQINPKLFKKHGEFLKDHLCSVAEILEKLQMNGWKLVESWGALYSLNLCKQTIKNKIELYEELNKLNINPEFVAIEEYEKDLQT